MCFYFLILIISPNNNNNNRKESVHVQEQRLTGGVLTPQTEGSLRARVISILIPYVLFFPRSLHKQMGLLSTKPASSGQHGLSGTVTLLPSVTYDKQSDMFSTFIKQSSSGEGDGPAAADGPKAIYGPGANACPDEEPIQETIIKKKAAAAAAVAAALRFPFPILANDKYLS